MNFTVHEIGNHYFVETEGYVVAQQARGTKEALIENFRENYEQIKERAANEEEAFEQFIETCGMEKREDWVNYSYDGHSTNLLEEDGYEATLPINYATNGRLKLTIRYWKSYEDEVLYCVFDDNGSWKGTIRNYGENPTKFFERFIGEVCFHNGILEEEFHNKLFPFSSHLVKKEFNFTPGAAFINPVQDLLGLS